MVRLSCSDKTERQGLLLAMNTITQTMRFRQAVLEYSNKYGVTRAAIRYKLNRQYIYRWRKRYDGTVQSLADRSHRPHSHPNQHTPEEIKLILDMRRRNPHTGLVVFWVKLRQRGYTRSISGLYRFPSQTRTDGSQAAQSQTQAQTLRADAVPRPARPDRREIRPSKLYCWTRKRNAVLSIHFYR